MSQSPVKLKIAEQDLLKPSVLTLIAANLIPLFGVLFLGWSTFAIVVIYWAENVIIGAINVLKMIVCSPTIEALQLANTSAKNLKGNSKQVRDLLEKGSKGLTVAHHGSKLFCIPFFIFHYGLFCFVHGVFIFELLGGGGAMFGGLTESGWYFYERLRDENLLWAVAALAASHLFSFFANFIYLGEYTRITVLQLMFQPYARIVLLHVAILFGAFLIQLLGSPIWMLVILIAGKTLMDIGLHLAERGKNAVTTDPTISTTQTDYS